VNFEQFGSPMLRAVLIRTSEIEAIVVLPEIITGTRGEARSHVAAQALKMNARLARAHGGSALLASGERAVVPPYQGPEASKNHSKGSVGYS
jgi:hypothetical protein